MTHIGMPAQIGTPEDQLQMTVTLVENYLSGEQLHASKAQIAAQQMHSLQDWTIQHRLTNFGCQNGNEFRNKIYSSEPRLMVIRDFANATKHGGLLKNCNRVLKNVRQSGDFSRAFSRRDFNTVRLEMHIVAGTALHAGGYVDNGKYLEMDDVLKDCLGFWTSLFETNEMPDNHANPQEVDANDGTHKYRIPLPNGVDSTADQLAIAEQMADQSSDEGTPVATYLAAAAIAPLEHWGYEDLKIPMEFPNKRYFRQYLYSQSPAIRATRELARAAKSGARVISSAGRMAIASTEGSLSDSAETFGKAIAFWQKMLAENAGYGRK